MVSPKFVLSPSASTESSAVLPYFDSLSYARSHPAARPPVLRDSSTDDGRQFRIRMLKWALGTDCGARRIPLERPSHYGASSAAHRILIERSLHP